MSDNNRQCTAHVWVLLPIYRHRHHRYIILCSCLCASIFFSTFALLMCTGPLYVDDSPTCAFGWLYDDDESQKRKRREGERKEKKNEEDDEVHIFFLCLCLASLRFFVILLFIYRRRRRRLVTKQTYNQARNYRVLRSSCLLACYTY